MDGPKMDQFWEDSSGGTHSHGHGQHLSYERNLNFSTVAVDDNEYGYPKKKTVRDPLSHRIIEKRRRDRMNNCLADLARLLPPSSLRKGRGRIEKTEIVELAIKHLRHLQCHPCPHSDNCEYNQIPIPRSSSSSHPKPSSVTGSSPSSSSSGTSGGTHGGSNSVGGGNSEEYFRLGYQESLSETMHFLVEREGMYAGDDLCVRIVKHLNKHCETLLRDQFGNKRKLTLGFTNRPGQNFKKGDGSLSSGYQPNGSSGSGSEGNLTNDGDTGTIFGPKTFPLPPLNSAAHSGIGASGGGVGEPLTPFDYEGDQNSCSSAQLSIEISDAFSEGKMPMIKPPIPTIICSHSSSNTRLSANVLINSGSPPVNSSNSDEGNSIKDNSPSSSHRYKFKNRIKQRFEDRQTEIRDNHHERRESLSRQSLCDSNTLRDSDSPDFQPPTPEAGPMAGSDCEKGMLVSRPTSVDPNPNQEAIPQGVTKENSHEDDTTSETINAPPVTDEKVDLKIIPKEDDCTLLVDEKPIVELLSMKAPVLPIIASLAGLQEAKALAVSGGKTVPAFALHDKGLYYVPLTLDKSLVAPIFAASEKNTQPPLHPVTISVCFLIAPDGKPVTGDIPIVPPPPAAVPIPLRSASPPPSMPHPPSHHNESTRDTHNFIMNRFAQSQVPMMFGGSGYPMQVKGDTSSRYPFSMCGSTGSGSFSSHTNAGSVGSNSDQQVKLYHHISNNSPDSGSSNYYSRSSSRSGASANTGHESSSRLQTPHGGSSSRSRKRSVSISPSVSIGYHSWNEKSHSDDMYMNNTLSSHSGGLISACPQPMEMNERHSSMRRHSTQQPQLQQPSQQTLHGHYQEAIEASEAAAMRREKRERERDASSYMGSKRSKKSRTEEEVVFSPSRHSVPSN